MTKKLLFSLAILLLLTPMTFATGGHAGLPAPTEAKTQIEAAHGGSIDCGVITDSEFEQMGEAWMETQHPGAQHKFMDNMMGGEGSTSLSAAHIRMGQSYLGCGSFGSFDGMMNSKNANSSLNNSGTMGNSAINNTGWMGTSGMMGEYNFSLFGGLLILLHLVIVLGFIALVVWIVKIIWKSK